MWIWLRRTVALALTSFGVALLVLPFSTSRTSSVHRERLRFRKLHYAEPATAEARLGISAKKITPSELAHYPAVKRGIDLLLASRDGIPRETWITDPAGEWRSFARKLTGQPVNHCLLIYRGGLIEGNAAERELSLQRSGPITLRYLGLVAPANVPVISKSDLDQEPALRKAVGGGGTSQREFLVTANLWQAFSAKHLARSAPPKIFSLGGKYYAVESEWIPERSEVKIPGYPGGLRIIGAVLLLVGLSRFRQLYPRGQGEAANPRRLAIIWDGISLAFALPAAALTADALVSRLFSVDSLAGEDPYAILGFFFFVAGIPVLALVTTRFTRQKV